MGVIKKSCLLLGALLVLQVGCEVVTKGDYFVTNSAIDRNGAGVFILDDVILPSSVAVYRFTAYCVRIAPVWFQIWRPVDLEGKVYQLIGQTRLMPSEVPRKWEVTLYTRDEIIFGAAGDRLGIWNEEDKSPLGYDFVNDVNNPLFHYDVGVNPNLFVGKEVQFGDVSFPYRFSVSVTFDTDYEKFLNGGTGTLLPPTIPPSPRTTIPPIPPDEGTFKYIGNVLNARTGIMESSARGLYLIHHVKFRLGVIVKFYAFFVRQEPVWFQVWRLKNETTDEYMLVGQHRVVPQGFPRTEAFSLGPDSYIFTEDNDILGFMNEGSPGAIGYSWNVDPLQPRPWASQLREEEPLPSVGLRFAFTTQDLPYDFGIGATYDTVPDPEIYGTPPLITEPTTTTTTVKSTTIPATFSGHVVGKDNLRYTNRTLPSGARKTFLMKDLQFPLDGVMKSFWAYFVNSGRIEMQVWRKENDQDFLLVGKKDYFSSNYPGFVEIPLDETEEFDVMKGDSLGFSNEEDSCAIGYHFETSDLYYTNSVFDTEANEVMTFHQLPSPYNFALGAVYLPPGLLTTEGTSKEEVTSTSSARTQEVTPTSATTVATSGASSISPGASSGQKGESPYGWLLDPEVMLGFLIWLIILTVFFFILCIVGVCCRKKNKTDSAIYRTRPYSGFINPVSSSRPSSYTKHWGSMKDDEVLDYFNPTIGKSTNRVAPNGNSGFDDPSASSGSVSINNQGNSPQTNNGNSGIGYTHM